ncbi:uncharacterized protein LOC135494338 [Lineus longissimus]|uniref:uncharacterized protein LOC135494338 n=1 Tax=Lineus longissimus TaxID=88925 RepID=UPI00315C93A2
MRKVAGSIDDGTEIDITMIKKAIDGMSKKKAADREGFRPEHLKLLSCSQLAMEKLTAIFNSIMKAKKAPKIMKTAYKIPIPKKGKDSLLLDNYRGITITSIFGKLLELICLMCTEKDLTDGQSGLQYGFSAGRSPSMASLLVTEAIAETKEKKQDLLICSLDARKAFDVVSHSRLKLKMFGTPMKKFLWCLIDDLYDSSTEVVRWCGEDSREYAVRQGVKQGAVMSPTLYKLYANDLASSLTKAGLGLHIGPTYIGSPGCADDLLLLTSSPMELQAMMSVSNDHSNTNLYELHPVKSVVCPHHQSQASSSKAQEWHLGGKPAAIAGDFVHLGLNWQKGKTRPDISPRITLARRTAYALMGVGFHSYNGLDPSASMKIYDTFVIPRLLHGLEATILSAAQVSQLDLFHRKALRLIQSLPESTAKSAIYLLLGTIPIEATIHARQLSLFGAITRLDRNNPLWQVAQRQLSLKSDTSKSWFNKICKTAEKYGINIHQALQHPWKKCHWKDNTIMLIKDSWTNALVSEAQARKTLQWIILDQVWIGRPHPLWQACKGKQYLVTEATTRARLLVGRFGLRQDRVRFNKQEVDPQCPLCRSEEEDAPHFLVTCPSLEKDRGNLISTLCSLYQGDGLPPPQTKTELCYAILNGWGYRMDVLTYYTIHTLNGNTKNINTSSIRNTPIISLKSNTDRANSLCNLICHRLYIARDCKYNDLL